MLRRLQPTPKAAISKAEADHRVIEPLIISLQKFPNQPEYRLACDEALHIDRPWEIIDGLDKLAGDYNLEATKRNRLETNPRNDI